MMSDRLPHSLKPSVIMSLANDMLTVSLGGNLEVTTVGSWDAKAGFLCFGKGI